MSARWPPSAQRDIVARHVDEAVAAGARVTTGGKPTGVGTFFEPTVLVDVEHSMSCMTEETFGPTLPVVKVADEDEAIRLANDSRYGLSASVWTSDNAGAASGWHAGSRRALSTSTTALVNALQFAAARWPAVRTPAIGARHGGADGLLKYCRPQAITTPRIPVAVE